MNADIQYREEDIKKYNREVYVRLARESCMKNYYGDKMRSRDEILKEVEEKRNLERMQHQDVANVIPYDEERWQRAENRNYPQRPVAISKAHTDQPVVRMNADIINQRLSERIHQNDDRRNLTTEYEPESVNDCLTGDTTRLPSLDLIVKEPPEENIPDSEDILRMSGIEPEVEETPHSYVEDFTQTYHEDEPDNFLTSIRNPEPEQEQKKQLDPEERKSFRMFAIRCVAALLLLAGVIFIDKMKYEYQGLTANTIYEKITSTEFVEEITQWVMEKAGK